MFEGLPNIIHELLVSGVRILIPASFEFSTTRSSALEIAVTTPAVAVCMCSVPSVAVRPNPLKTLPCILPVVVKFSLSNEIFPVVSVIEPVANTRVFAVTVVPANTALATPNPPSVCIEPVSPLVESVTSFTEIAPDVVRAPVTVCAPLANVPVVDMFSLSKVIAPLESVMDPEASVRVPIVSGFVTPAQGLFR